MRMGVREICDVVFRPLTSVDIGNQHFDAGQPVLYLDTAKTSTLEGAATTVYAQGGKGNPRLIGWDGEKTLTFTVEDALISPVSFAMLSGAGIVKGVGAADADSDVDPKIYTHQIYDLVIEGSGAGNYYARLPQDIRDGATLVVSKEAPIYATTLDSAGAPKYFLSAISKDEVCTDKDLATAVTTSTRGVVQIAADADIYFKLTSPLNDYDESAHGSHQSTQEQDPAGGVGGIKAGDTVRIDCYTVHGAGAQEIQIDAENFAGYYYIEADTLFREEATGQDLPAQFIIPRGKIQSNFTFTMANSGDPSTFTFTIDAFPAYTKFNKRKKVMAALQIIDPSEAKHNYANKQVVGHDGREADHDDYFNNLYDKSIFEQIGESSDNTGLTEEEQAAVDAVNAMPVDTADEKLAALQAYNKLTDAQKAAVSTETKLAIGVASEEETQAAADAAAIAAVIEASNADPFDATDFLVKYAKLTDEQEAAVLADENLGAEALALLA